MTELTLYFALFSSAFLSATLLPGSSEAALVTLLGKNQGNLIALVAIATVGNVFGSYINWLLGRSFAHYRDRPWFPLKPAAWERAINWYGRYGVWSLLFSWVPIIGDPLTFAAGALRTCFLRFVVTVGIGKLVRYLVVAGAFVWWSH